MGTCALCRRNRELKRSHIIPRFVFKWMKKTAPTPFLRTGEDKGTRMQDWKERLLCGECEQKFEKWESKFAAQVFHPFVRNEATETEYGKWLQKFIISVTWRLLQSERTKTSHLSEEFQQELQDAATHWRELLLEDETDDRYEHHIFFFGTIEEVGGPLHDRYESYMYRATDGVVAYSEDKMMYYYKFPRMMFFSSVRPRVIEDLENTRIEEEGTLTYGGHTMHEELGRFVESRVEKAFQMTPPEEEMEKIMDYMERNPERFVKSDTLQVRLREQMRRTFQQMERYAKWMARWEQLKRRGW